MEEIYSYSPLILPKRSLDTAHFFRICIEGTVSGYSYELCDRLAKDQLWAALKNQQCLPDVEFIVMDKTFPAHKAILAARSIVFATEFKKKQPGKDGRHQIRIDDVEPSTVNKFLHFIYTGELMGALADEELLKLAYHYQLSTLVKLCRVALKEIEAMQMTSIMKCLHSNVGKLSTDDFIIMYNIFFSFIPELIFATFCLLTFPLYYTGRRKKQRYSLIGPHLPFDAIQNL
jgi:hypothetical protein